MLSGARAYPGDELELFAEARNWKAYWREQVSRYVRGDVLEVGAGLGANTSMLRGLTTGRWLCLEPDPELLSRLRAATSGASVESHAGTTESLDASDRFDTALYLDVLEHIEGDAQELGRAARHLRPGGHLVVLSPAHSFLYSPFDRAIGHLRRYGRTELLACGPPGARVVLARYLDSAGLLLSLANRVLLRQSYPSRAQLRLWDRRILPISRALDPLTGFRAGKTILVVWRV